MAACFCVLLTCDILDKVPYAGTARRLLAAEFGRNARFPVFVGLELRSAVVTLNVTWKPVEYNNARSALSVDAGRVNKR